MKIVIFGAGGVGGYFGARLAAAGADVAFIARGAHLKAMREQGLQIYSSFGDLHLKQVTASDDPAALGPADIVLFCTKLYDTDSAAPTLKPLLKADTAAISLQNGVDSEDRIAAAIGRNHVVGGVAHISAVIDSPGAIRHLNKFHRLTFGELDGSRSERLQRFHTLAKNAGLDAHLSDDINTAIWDKFVFLAPMAAVTGVTRQSIGPILADPDLRALLADSVREVAAVARAQGAKLLPDAAERAVQMAEALPPEMKASLAHDLERGNRLELDGLSGAVVKLGAAAGVPTPVHRTIYAALKPFKDGRVTG